MSLADSFRRVIETADPQANSPITIDNSKVKVLADWGRHACDELDRLQAEIEVLRRKNEHGRN